MLPTGLAPVCRPRPADRPACRRTARGPASSGRRWGVQCVLNLLVEADYPRLGRRWTRQTHVDAGVVETGERGMLRPELIRRRDVGLRCLRARPGYSRITCGKVHPCKALRVSTTNGAFWAIFP